MLDMALSGRHDSTSVEVKTVIVSLSTHDAQDCIMKPLSRSLLPLVLSSSAAVRGGVSTHSLSSVKRGTDKPRSVGVRRGLATARLNPHIIRHVRSRERRRN